MLVNGLVALSVLRGAVGLHPLRFLHNRCAVSKSLNAGRHYFVGFLQTALHLIRVALDAQNLDFDLLRAQLAGGFNRGKNEIFPRRLHNRRGGHGKTLASFPQNLCTHGLVRAQHALRVWIERFDKNGLAVGVHGRRDENQLAASVIDTISTYKLYLHSLLHHASLLGWNRDVNFERMILGERSQRSVRCDAVAQLHGNVADSAGERSDDVVVPQILFLRLPIRNCLMVTPLVLLDGHLLRFDLLLDSISLRDSGFVIVIPAVELSHRNSTLALQRAIATVLRLRVLDIGLLADQGVLQRAQGGFCVRKIGANRVRSRADGVGLGCLHARVDAHDARARRHRLSSRDFDARDMPFDIGRKRNGLARFHIAEVVGFLFERSHSDRLNRNNRRRHAHLLRRFIARRAKNNGYK